MSLGAPRSVPAEVRIDTRLVMAHTIAAFGGLIVSALFGLLVSLWFNAPTFLSQHAWSTWLTAQQAYDIVAYLHEMP